jgi:thiol-disulfide isomerase/thioredoxin
MLKGRAVFKRLMLATVLSLGVQARDMPVDTYLKGSLSGMQAVTKPLDLSGYSVIDSVTNSGVNLARLGEKKGKTLLVTFWTRDCLICRGYLKELAALQTTLGKDKFEVVAINIGRDSHKYTENWLRRLGVTELSAYTHFHHGIVNELNANPWFQFYGRQPRSLLVDGEGKVIAYSSVKRDWTTEEGQALLAALMQGDL